jgi:adenine-specific DNA glycosylase
MFPHWLISHGRQVCDAKKPKCTECVLSDVCPSYDIFTRSTGMIAAKPSAKKKVSLK